MRTEFTTVRSFATVAADWEALENRASDASVFQGWGWVGCLAEERYTDPVLLRAFDPAGRLQGLALFNRRAGALHLAESGDAALDAPFIEHNAPLVADGPEGRQAMRALLRAAWRVAGARRLVLSGIEPEVLALASGTPWRCHARIAPALDLQRLPDAGLLQSLSANARYQIRRSARALEALGGGALRLETAATETQALAWFEDLALLHAETWRLRGQAGAFADPAALRFHRALIPRCLARDELALQRVVAGEDLVVGYLYNLRRNGRVFAYQSGLRQPGDPAREKPGLTCHALAIDAARAAGDTVYDFLAGDARYKRSLANRQAILLWVDLVPRWSPRGVLARLVRRDRLPVTAPAAESP